MTLILAIDAAWTDTEPSGVALLTASGPRGKWLCVAPSYDAFIEYARGTHIDWVKGKFRGSKPDVHELLRAARAIAGTDVDLVAVDMPVAAVAFSTRRAADNAISVAFGGRGCSAHSPSALRPGALGAELTDQLRNVGYELVTSDDHAAVTRKFIEVYPHPALLALLRASYRIPTKSRSRPGTGLARTCENESTACSRSSPTSKRRSTTRSRASPWRSRLQQPCLHFHRSSAMRTRSMPSCAAGLLRNSCKGMLCPMATRPQQSGFPKLLTPRPRSRVYLETRVCDGQHVSAGSVATAG